MMPSPQNYGAYKVYNGLAPKGQPRALPLTLDFSVANPLYLDFELAQSENKIEWVQSLFIDNSKNPNPLTLTCAISGQVIELAAGWQGYIQVLVPNTPRFTVSTTGTPLVPVQLLTFPMPIAAWNTAGGSTGQDFSANKPSFYANLAATVPANAQRANIEVQNQCAEQIQVVLDDGAGNNVSILLLAAGSGGNTQGGSWTSQTFKGRLRVYLQNSTDQFYLHQD